MSDIIKQIEAAQLRSDLPSFSPGDTVVVGVKVIDGSRERVQNYEGVVIAVKNRGLNSAFTVRKISYGEGVERVFQTHSPMIDSVAVIVSSMPISMCWPSPLTSRWRRAALMATDAYIPAIRSAIGIPAFCGSPSGSPVTLMNPPMA